jgi:hypothetical protein
MAQQLSASKETRMSNVLRNYISIPRSLLRVVAKADAPSTMYAGMPM